MSFITTPDSQAKVYAPGWFLKNNEQCTRETRQFAQDSALVKTADNGGKYVPMGTAYPTNDANAIGIAYEDVDVSSGDMPGSVVTKGEVYEDRLAVTSVEYSAATTSSGDNPSEKGWYERHGLPAAYEYTKTTDTTVQSGKTYYAQTVTRLASAAKTALAALGFTFTDSPVVTRLSSER